MAPGSRRSPRLSDPAPRATAMLQTPALLGALLVPTSGQEVAPEPAREERIAWLSEHAAEILAPGEWVTAEDDFADLQPLAEAVGGKRIVTLGEASHSDGSAFELKARVARFLHERCGYDVLVFEAGLYECDRAWREAVDGASLVERGRAALQPIWERSRTVQELLRYMQASVETERPLVFAGMDMMPTGLILAEAGEDLVRAAREAAVDESLAAAGQRLIETLPMGLGRLLAAPAAEREESCRVLLELAAALRDGRRVPERARFMAQFLESLVACIEMLSAADMSDPEGSPELNRRDEQMAKNLVFLAREVFPDKKLLVWGATSHLSRRRDGLQVYTAPYMVPIGEHLTSLLPDSTYHLAVTSFEGKIGSATGSPEMEIPAAPAGSLEELWAATGVAAGFLDLRSLQPGTSWVQGPISVRAMGHGDVTGRWSESVDGILFTRDLLPAAPGE